MIAANRQSDVQNILLRAFSFIWKYPFVSNWKVSPCLVKQFVLYTMWHHISSAVVYELKGLNKAASSACRRAKCNLARLIYNVIVELTADIEVSGERGIAVQRRRILWQSLDFTLWIQCFNHFKKNFCWYYCCLRWTQKKSWRCTPFEVFTRSCCFVNQRTNCVAASSSDTSDSFCIYSTLPTSNWTHMQCSVSPFLFFHSTLKCC
jgi:hypothetical protein